MMLYKRIYILFCFSFVGIWAHAQQLQHAELLGRPTDVGVTLKMIYSDSVEIKVSYGTQSANLTQQTNWILFADGWVEITLQGLQPDTKYYYSVSQRSPSKLIEQTRSERTFHTARKPGSAFTFVLQADPHMDEQTDTVIYARCLQNQVEDQPDFMVDLGDFLMTDKLRNASKQVPKDTITYRCHLLRSYYEKSVHSVPLYIALGNHEGEAGWYLNNTANNIAVWDTKDRKRFFANPEPNQFYSGDTTQHAYVGLRQNYYAWTWGDALFIVLDPYWYTNPKPDSLNGWRWTLGKGQYDWLRNTLEHSSAKFKYIFSHQIIGGDPDGRGGVEFADLYEWGGKNLNGSNGFSTNRSGWYKPLKELFKENKVNIFFHGHDHFFGKQEKECLVYQETPQPSHPNFANAGQAKTYGYLQGQILPNSGHIRVSVDGNGTKVEYVRAYKAADETATRHNKDVSATYYIGAVNCYDSMNTGATILWNTNYDDEIVYPNPFSRETVLQFNIKQQQRITAQVFDESGKLVVELLNSNEVAPGQYKIVWEGNNMAGHAQPNGVYYYKISSVDGVLFQGKMVLQRN